MKRRDGGRAALIHPITLAKRTALSGLFLFFGRDDPGFHCAPPRASQHRPSGAPDEYTQLLKLTPWYRLRIGSGWNAERQLRAPQICNSARFSIMADGAVRLPLDFDHFAELIARLRRASALQGLQVPLLTAEFVENAGARSARGAGG